MSELLDLEAVREPTHPGHARAWRYRGRVTVWGTATNDLGKREYYTARCYRTGEDAIDAAKRLAVFLRLAHRIEQLPLLPADPREDAP